MGKLEVISGKSGNLHSRSPIHKSVNEGRKASKHDEDENGLVEVVELDEGGQGEDGDDPNVDEIL